LNLKKNADLAKLTAPVLVSIFAHSIYRKNPIVAQNIWQWMAGVLSCAMRQKYNDRTVII
jgi:hypothetical protein